MVATEIRMRTSSPRLMATLLPPYPCYPAPCHLLPHKKERPNDETLLCCVGPIKFDLPVTQKLKPILHILAG